MKRSLHIGALLLALLCGIARAEVGHSSGAISVTSTSATTTFSGRLDTLTLWNHSSSANELYVRIFYCDSDTPAAATTDDIEIPVNISMSVTSYKRPICAVSYVTAAAETANLKLIYQQ